MKNVPISKVAIGETIAACLGALTLSIVTNSALPILVPALGAPIVLLRSPPSNALAISLARAYKLQIRDGSERPLEPELASLAIRFYSTVVGVIRFPRASIEAFPRNWLDACCSTSLLDRWSMVPNDGEPMDLSIVPSFYAETAGSEDASDYRVYQFSKCIAILAKACLVLIMLASIPIVGSLGGTLRSLGFEGFWPLALLLLALYPLMFAFGGSAFFVLRTIIRIGYRSSVKASALVWLPLLYAIAPTQWNKPSVEIVDDIAHGAVSRMALWAGFLTIVLFLIWPLVASVTTNYAQQYGPNLASISSTVYPWEAAAVFNALLAIGLWIYCDGKLRTHTYRPELMPSLSTIATIARRVVILRRVIAIYTIPNSLYLLTYIQGWTDVLRFQPQLWRWG